MKILQESLSDFSKFTNENNNKTNDKKNDKKKDINNNNNDIDNDNDNNIINSSKIFLPFKENRETCYQCYKIHLESKSIVYLGKKFCTKECINKCIEEESVII